MPVAGEVTFRKAGNRRIIDPEGGTLQASDGREANASTELPAYGGGGKEPISRKE